MHFPKPRKYSIMNRFRKMHFSQVLHHLKQISTIKILKVFTEKLEFQKKLKKSHASKWLKHCWVFHDYVLHLISLVFKKNVYDFHTKISKATVALSLSKLMQNIFFPFPALCECSLCFEKLSLYIFKITFSIEFQSHTFKHKKSLSPGTPTHLENLEKIKLNQNG